MSLTKATYSMIQGAPANVLDFGADPTGVADSASAFQAAVDAASGGGGNGGIFVPGGTYRINSIVYLDNCDLIGDGLSPTRINSYATGDCFRLGQRSASSGVVTGGSIQKMLISLYGISSIGIRVLSCQNAVVRDVYIGGSYGFPNTQTGIIMDGGASSGYFNQFENINVVGPDVGYKLDSSAGGFLTQQFLINCSALTYAFNPTSTGILFVGNNGLDSTIVAGNFESCKIGMKFATGTWSSVRTQGLTLLGVRFEANMYADIDWGNGGSLNTRIGYANFGNNSNRVYTFNITNANANYGATYTNNGVTFTVMNTISGGTTLVAYTGTSGGSPTASGTLTKTSGTGDATITFSSSTYVAFDPNLNFDNTRNNGTHVGKTVNGMQIASDPGSNYGYTNLTFGNNSAFQTTPNGTRRDNIFMGDTTGNALTTGSDNIGIGSNALKSVTTTNNNVGVGSSALANCVSNENAAVGSGAGNGLTSGGGNTFVGAGAAAQATTGSGNIAIGQNVGWFTYALLNLTTQSNRILIGDTQATNAYVNVAWTVVSDARDKTDIEDSPYGLAFVDSLRPVKYKRDDRSRYIERLEDGTEIIHPQDGSKKDDFWSLGFLAQEVIDAEKAAGAADGEYLIADAEMADKLKITETRMIPALVKSIQELKAEFDAYKASHP